MFSYIGTLPAIDNVTENTIATTDATNIGFKIFIGNFTTYIYLKLFYRLLSKTVVYF